MPSLPRVLLIATDTIGRQMAGPGIRYWNLARILATQQPVTLAVQDLPSLDPPPGVSIVPYGEGDRSRQGKYLAELAGEHEVIVSQMPPYLYFDEELIAKRHMVIDLYAPWYLEKLEYARVDPGRGEPLRADDLEILQRLLEIGDFYICASERQRDFWLGSLTVAGRLNTRQLEVDPEMRSLIDIVPIGLSDKRPIPNGPGPREIYPFIDPHDPIMLWNGGIWNWLDPVTAIQATYQLVNEGYNPRLIFMGVKSPSLEIAEMELVESARNLASKLDLEGRHVIFNDWVAYDQRQNWLLQSAMTLSLHQPTIESRFAFRTRILDNLWCRVPAVATEGDVLADLVASHGLGRVVPPANPRAVAEAMLSILNANKGGEIRRRIGTVAKSYTWEQVSEPLLRYCSAPWKNRPGADTEDYVHKLERLYAETAEYARSLEQAIEEKNHALEELERLPQQERTPWNKRLQVWKRNV
ncbi:MAG: glycosyltransferase family 4 protein [Thermomicrobiales bacterium]